MSGPHPFKVSVQDKEGHPVYEDGKRVVWNLIAPGNWANPQWLESKMDSYEYRELQRRARRVRKNMNLKSMELAMRTVLIINVQMLLRRKIRDGKITTQNQAQNLIEAFFDEA